MVVSKHIGPKKSYKENWQNSQLYQLFMHDFLSHNAEIFPLHILLTKNRCIWSKGIDKFWSGCIKTFWAQKILHEKQKIDKFHKGFCIMPIFHMSQMFQYPQIIYCWYVLKAFLPFCLLLPPPCPNFANALPLPIFILIFISKKWFYPFLTNLLVCFNATIL